MGHACNAIESTKLDTLVARAFGDLSAGYGGVMLGAQAGEARLAEVFREAGFTHFRRAFETPFNLVLEARL